jgi:hypothetical protein
VRRYFKVKRAPRPEHTFKQTQRGRPGPDTEYRRVTKRRYDIEWTIDYDKKSDGMYPLICNDRKLTCAQVLEAHKIAPVFLKNTGRIEAFTLYFLALLIQALIERQLRLQMQHQKITQLPIYPEQRRCKHPTTEQILRLFGLAERHTLLREERPVQVFLPERKVGQVPERHHVLHASGGEISGRNDPGRGILLRQRFCGALAAELNHEMADALSFKSSAAEE